MNSQAMYLPLLISALAFLMSFVSFIYFNSYLKRRTGQKQILAELQEEVNNILKSINDTTDRNISLIEDGEKKLTGLLGEIEKRLRVYIREMERFGNPGTLNKPIERSFQSEESRSIGGTSGKPAAEKYRELGKNRYRIGKPNQAQAAEPAQAPEAPQMPESQQAPVASKVPPPVQAAQLEPAFPIPNFDIKAEAPEKPAPPLAEQVRSLLRSGFSPTIVAGRLGVSIAEVELAAALLELREE